jgi:cytochrome c peroxidase
MNRLSIIILIIFIISGCDKYEPDCNISEVCSETFTPTNISLTYPNNFPSPNTPEWNPLTEEGVNLGRHLFYDPILSSDNTISCASCHKQEYAFGANTQFSFGVNQALGTRHSPTIMNVAFQEQFDWDGKSNSLEEQASRPIFNEIELHNNNWSEVINRLAMSDIYPDLFCAAFGTEEIDSLSIVMAISQFERTLISSNSRFDQWLRGEVAFTSEELDGFNIFSSERGDCFHCHPTGLFTDNIFHNNGLDSDFTDMGRYDITGNPLDKGLFKSPSLRNIEFSAPYMHDGRFNTLDEVIEHYNFGGYDSPTVDPLMKYIYTNPYNIPGLTGLLLTEEEKANLKAFLLTLSDPLFIENPNLSNPFND